jgi:FeS assembly ATPase SufC
MLEIKGLTAGIEGKQILKGIDLVVPSGEIHAIMGPNGSGKSTLSYVLSGRNGYEVTGGSATLDGRDLLEMAPDARAAAGLFLAFQYPVELPGVGNANFLRTALNAQRRSRRAVPQDRPRRHQETLDGRRSFAPQCQCRVLRRREEAQRGAADGDPQAELRHP